MPPSATKPADKTSIGDERSMLKRFALWQIAYIGKVKRSHRKDNEEFYACHTFFFFDDFKKQLAIRQRQYNNFPMRPSTGNHLNMFYLLSLICNTSLTSYMIKFAQKHLKCKVNFTSPNGDTDEILDYERP